MVHGIVRQHQGWVECESRVGVGTSFTIYLPAIESPATPKKGSSILPWATTRRTPVASPPPAREPGEPGGSGGTILLVDDEDMIRELGRSILEASGYTVLESVDGAEGVDLFRDRHPDIDLVILDLTMPRMSGRDAFRAMAAINPAARVLLSSGYSSDDLTDVSGAVGLLSKPYRPADLLAVVRRALSEPLTAGTAN